MRGGSQVSGQCLSARLASVLTLMLRVSWWFGVSLWGITEYSVRPKICDSQHRKHSNCCVAGDCPSAPGWASSSWPLGTGPWTTAPCESRTALHCGFISLGNGIQRERGRLSAWAAFDVRCKLPAESGSAISAGSRVLPCTPAMLLRPHRSCAHGRWLSPCASLGGFDVDGFVLGPGHESEGGRDRPSSSYWCLVPAIRSPLIPHNSHRR